MSLAESILEDTFGVRRRPALLAGRARNALGVADGPPAEPRPARRADHLRAEGPPEERAGGVHPRRRAARPGARREALPRARARAMDDYAAARLGLQHAQLYRYLAVYDWIREFHRPWLARRPKGFIPELT